MLNCWGCKLLKDVVEIVTCIMLNRRDVGDFVFGYIEIKVGDTIVFIDMRKVFLICSFLYNLDHLIDLKLI